MSGKKKEYFSSDLTALNTTTANVFIVFKSVLASKKKK